jgi:hypothetical protein
MIFQRTHKIAELIRHSSITETNQFELLKGLPFYDWQHTVQLDQLHVQLDQLHVQLDQLHTFNHAIGLPEKNGQAFPLFDYEQMLFDTLQNHKHVWIKKATGLGVTEFMLRYMAWLCCSGFIKNSQMCIVTGPRIELAITLIDRMKGLFQNRSQTAKSRSDLRSNSITFDTKETVRSFLMVLNS